MGFFTFTLADREPVPKKSGGYMARSVARYGRYAAAVLPDGTILETRAYDGYGRFGGQDIYELVAEWNRDALPGILDRPCHGIAWTKKHTELALAWAAHDDARFARALDAVSEIDPIMRNRWKRYLGICISDGIGNADLPYPIKIVASKGPWDYDALKPSIATQ